MERVRGRKLFYGVAVTFWGWVQSEEEQSWTTADEVSETQDAVWDSRKARAKGTSHGRGLRGLRQGSGVAPAGCPLSHTKAACLGSCKEGEGREEGPAGLPSSSAYLGQKRLASPCPSSPVPLCIAATTHPQHRLPRLDCPHPQPHPGEQKPPSGLVYTKEVNKSLGAPAPGRYKDVPDGIACKLKSSEKAGSTVQPQGVAKHKTKKSPSAQVRRLGVSVRASLQLLRFLSCSACPCFSHVCADAAPSSSAPAPPGSGLPLCTQR